MRRREGAARVPPGARREHGRAWRSAALAILVGALLAACGEDGSLEPEPTDSALIVADRDNTLMEEATALSNGAGEHFFAGTTHIARRRGLVRFDLDGRIPTSATVDSVTLTLHMSRTTAGSTMIRLHRVTADWGEGTSKGGAGEGMGGPATPGDVTWLYRRFDTALWTTPGGDYAPTPSASASVAEIGTYRWESTPALVADVQAWLAAPASNFGWILIGDESRAVTSKRFDSRENADASRRPVLTVYFTRR